MCFKDQRKILRAIRSKKRTTSTFIANFDILIEFSVDKKEGKKTCSDNLQMVRFK